MTLAAQWTADYQAPAPGQIPVWLHGWSAPVETADPTSHRFTPESAPSPNGSATTPAALCLDLLIPRCIETNKTFSLCLTLFSFNHFVLCEGHTSFPWIWKGVSATLADTPFHIQGARCVLTLKVVLASIAVSNLFIRTILYTPWRLKFFLSIWNHHKYPS